MAIFIIDQFSLNTDLPLDIRYAPTGGSYNDVSAYWYPGMQVYQSSDETIWYADNSLNWHPIGGDVDASLSQIFQAISDISSLVNIHEASLGNLTIWNISQDASIEDLRAWNEAQDASILAIDTSLGNLTIWQEVQDASIDALRTDVNVHEASLGNLTTWNTIQDASIEALDLWNQAQDASIVDLTLSISGIEASLLQIDTSLGNITNWLIQHDLSLGNLTSWNEQQDTSLGNLTSWNEAQDITIANLDASLDLFVLRSGDTMTGELTVPGLIVQNDASIQGGLSVVGDSILQGDVAIGGSLTIDGSLYVTSTETIDVSANFIHLNTGLTGAPPATLQSGIVVGRGSEEPYVFLFDETDQTFRIGIASETSSGFLDASTQAVATREDNPIDGGVGYWNSTLNRIDTSVGFVFTADALTIDTSLNLGAYAGAQELFLTVDTDGTVKAVANPADASLNDLYTYIDGSLLARDISINVNTLNISNLDSSVTALDLLTQLHEVSLGNLTVWNEFQDTSISNLDTLTQLHETSLGNLSQWNIEQDASIDKLFDTAVFGAINVGDGSAGVYAGLTADGSIRMRELVGVGAAQVNENGDTIEISLDASFAGEVNTASNIGDGTGVFAQKVGEDLEFKTLNEGNGISITSDASNVYFDVSIAAISDASISGLTDTSINETAKVTHQILEFNSDGSKWENTNGILWDTSLGTTADGFNSIPAGTDLEGMTLKEILFKLLYEYQVPNLTATGSPVGGTFEKGSSATQFASIDINYSANNNTYPLAKLNNIDITKTGSGTIFDASFGLVDSSSGVYTDGAGITNWGGTSRTITYQVNVGDDQPEQSQPAVIDQVSYTFYYPQWWGVVDGNTNQGQVLSPLIKALDSSRLAGEVDLDATFDNSTGGFVKYLFVYPDTIISPDNFGTLSIIRDQNGYDVTSSFDTFNVDVSTDQGNIRHRAYLLKNKVDTSTFDITFTF